jgi:hypothetical protein
MYLMMVLSCRNMSLCVYIGEGTELLSLFSQLVQFTNYSRVVVLCRSQWPRGLRHELSSLARMLGSWVRIPLIAWMSVLCAFILCLCSMCR